MMLAEIREVQAALDLDDRALARVLAVSPATVGRWTAGESEPTGLHEEVLRALHGVALHWRGAASGKDAGAGAGADAGIGADRQRIGSGSAAW